jgi:hypothetical protein
VSSDEEDLIDLVEERLGSFKIGDRVVYEGLITSVFDMIGEMGRVTLLSGRWAQVRFDKTRVGTLWCHTKNLRRETP